MTKIKAKAKNKTAARRPKQIGLPFDAHAVMVAIRDAAVSMDKVELKRKEATRSTRLSLEEYTRPKSAAR